MSLQPDIGANFHDGDRGGSADHVERFILRTAFRIALLHAADLKTVGKASAKILSMSRRMAALSGSCFFASVRLAVVSAAAEMAIMEVRSHVGIEAS